MASNVFSFGFDWIAETAEEGKRFEGATRSEFANRDFNSLDRVSNQTFPRPSIHS
jgi:hypothetical protein